MSKSASLLSNTLASLEEQLSNQTPKSSNPITTATKATVENTVVKPRQQPKSKTTEPKTVAKPASQEQEIERSISGLEADLSRVISEEGYVTRNYGFKTSIDRDIDDLRVRLKRSGTNMTKQELVNVLLRERLDQLKNKGLL